MSVDVLLSDGSIAVIRPMTTTDRPALEALHRDVSDSSFRFRFFSSGRVMGRQYVTHLFSEDPPEVALVALVNGHLVALATAEATSPTTAEIAFLVGDENRGHGIGILLLEHLAAAGRDRGLTRFTADVLGDNAAMSRVFRDVGFQHTRSTSRGVTEVVMSTEASTRAVAAADAREATSEARSLASLRHPRRVAVVGVGRHGTGIGAAVLAAIVAGGFTGEVVVVHPTATDVGGVPAYPRLVLVPGHIDIVVVAVPARAIQAVLEDAVECGVSTVVIVSSGFAELGAEGAALQRDLVQLARSHSTRLIGPNCLGVQVNDATVRLNATFTPIVPTAGGLAVASQSGGVGVALLDLAVRTGLGVHTFLSLGNKADVSGNDLLAAWLDDPEVTAAALYLESFGNAPKFARIARRFSEQKPLLVVHGGQTVAGKRGGASHTAAAATSTVVVDALFAHCGIIACRSPEEMVETALVLAEQPLPRGRRIAVVTNAGGMGILAADAADAAGLVVEPLSGDLQSRLRAHAPHVAGTSNPVDIGAGAAAATLAATVNEVLRSDEVDALLVVLVATSVADPRPLTLALGEARMVRPDVPVLLVTIGATTPASPSPAAVTSLPSIGAATDALARVSRYADWRDIPREEAVVGDPVRGAEARRVAASFLATAGPTPWLTNPQAGTLLAPYGLVPEGELGCGGAAAARAAVRIGFPVAVKVADPAIVHKTDRGLVRTGLRDVGEVRAAVAAFEAELGTTGADVLVQPMGSGVELALGLVQDPAFGPLVMLAAGGTATDLWGDRAFLLPPLDGGSVTRALRSLRSWPLLDGYRGTPHADVVALIDLVIALGQLGTDVPAVAELDLNPVLVGASGTHLVDVKVRLAPGAQPDAGVPRRLRQPG